MQFHRVSRQLWVGGAMTADDWRQLSDQGVTVCVNLRADRSDEFGDRPPEAALWVPTPERAMPDADRLMMLVGFVDAAVRQGRRVVLHCREGTSRGPLAAIACLAANGMSYDEAVDALRAAGVRLMASAAQVAAVRDFIRMWRDQRRDQR